MTCKNIAVIALGTVISLSTLGGCSSTESSVNIERYSLIDGITSASMDREYKVTTKVYGILADGSLVIRTSDVGLRPAVHHKWSSKLEDQLSIIMRDALIKYSVPKNVEVAVEVKDFYGSTSGEVYIDAFVNAKNGKNTLFKDPFVYHGKQSTAGYSALASELKAGWIEICEQAAVKIAATAK